jgi:hypothetical protein
MLIPTIVGTIDRRILVNYRVDPFYLQRLLPAPFRPKLIHGTGLAGICLIRLNQVRPRSVPSFLGLTSENAAHRIAVVWEENGTIREGVYIPRRDTSSPLNTLVGSTLFSGVHHHAHFRVSEQGDTFRIQYASDDGDTSVEVAATLASHLPRSSIFASLEEASAFFEPGRLGYSVTRERGRLDALELRCQNWKMEPLDLTTARSSFFDDHRQFPPGAAELDGALLMRGIRHEWHVREPFHLPERLEGVNDAIATSAVSNNT